MSINGVSDPAKMSKKPFHWKNDSGELDVFEAARYFSDLNEVSGYNGTKLAHKMMRDERQPWRGGRMSLDMPAAIRDSLPSQTHFRENQTKKEKKYKQPSSPGGRLASFLNSLFNQTSSKKKKSKSINAESLKDGEESPGGRRRRRSSISHFRIASTNAADSKSIFSTSSSGFRTPPPYAYTPTKSYKDLYNDHHQVVSILPKVNGHVKSSTAAENQVCAEKKYQEYAWLDEKSRLSNGKIADKYKNINSNRFPERSRTSWADQYLSEEKEFRKFNEVDDDGGADSDSSSDLFELPNFDLDYSSSGLPVYETTNVDSIKRGAPISSGAR